MKLAIKDWSKFQHFKDRKPPWIKLYRDILDDVEWHELSGDDAKVLTMLWLIASECDGYLPDKKSLAFRLRISLKQLESTLPRLSHWVVSERYQSDITLSQDSSVADVSDHQETERETEEEREKETDTRKRVEPPDGVSVEVWSDFKKLRAAKKSPLTDTALQAIKREADKAGYTLNQVLETCCARGWTGFKADWVAEKPSPADVARQTVPSTPGRDPALIKAEEDAKRAAPIPPQLRETIAKLTGRAVA